MSNPGARFPPSAFALRRARRRGLVAYSATLSGAFGFCAASLALVGTGQEMWDQLNAVMRDRLTIAASSISGSEVPGATRALLGAAAELALPVLVTGVIVTVVAGLAQTRALFAPTALAPRASRLNVLAGLGRIASPHTAIASGAALTRWIALLAVASELAWRHAGDVARLSTVSPERAAEVTGVLACALLGRAAVIALVFGLIDYASAYVRHRRSLQVTREQRRREQRMVEPDPRHKLHRRRIYARMLRRDPRRAAHMADLAIVGDETAVLLRYDPNTTPAPHVVGKANDALARELIALARRAGVPVYRDRALARALAGSPIAGQIPPAQHDAVAQVMAAFR